MTVGSTKVESITLGIGLRLEIIIPVAVGVQVSNETQVVTPVCILVPSYFSPLCSRRSFSPLLKVKEKIVDGEQIARNDSGHNNGHRTLQLAVHVFDPSRCSSLDSQNFMILMTNFLAVRNCGIYGENKAKKTRASGNRGSYLDFDGNPQSWSVIVGLSVG
ncbi:hypothetical protein J6590_042545 [Homalodisca vitripennis]|nr:hypothetical protein J6590_042545 [Homalodisca vitripennis]